MLAVQIYGKEEEIKQLALRLTDVVKVQYGLFVRKAKRTVNKKIQVLGPALPTSARSMISTGMCSM